ncbi:MAG: hypothetical protein H0U29_05755 [Acidimicrobiia bacterium]|nr:hypothetical protein [Acidimicrobiia bacterium]
MTGRRFLREASPRVLLALAAALAVVSLGVEWGRTPYSPGLVLPGTTLTNQFNPSTGDLDLVIVATPGTYLPGSGGDSIRGADADARILLAPAAGVLVWAFRRRSDRSRRAVRLAAAGLAAAAVLALSRQLAVPALMAGTAAWCAWRAADPSTGPERPAVPAESSSGATPSPF